MLSQLALTPPYGRRLLYWGVRNQEDFFAATEVADLCRAAGCEQRLFLTNAPAGWTGDRGRITPVILSEFPELTAPTFYLVGNGAMISELKRELVARGVNRKKQIRTEAFFD
jgi:NAD(P)H-flavin reductase